MVVKISCFLLALPKNHPCTCVPPAHLQHIHEVAKILETFFFHQFLALGCLSDSYENATQSRVLTAEADIRLAAFQLTNCLDFFQSMRMAHGDLKPLGV